MVRLTHIDSGFEWTFATIEDAIAYLETFTNQEEFEIRRQTARSIFFNYKTNICSAGLARAQETHGRVYEKNFFKKVLTRYKFYDIIQIQ